MAELSAERLRALPGSWSYGISQGGRVFFINYALCNVLQNRARSVVFIQLQVLSIPFDEYLLSITFDEYLLKHKNLIFGNKKSSQVAFVGVLLPEPRGTMEDINQQS
ncbi:hypothetical protein DUI87_19927 [Hirundo rustica rustica]|uniref:Uncharacterized protein n=1 Tax=Hirundo rustica rustica TaxID=333673 RepID=A0A3M0K6K3_HIRRU|nr:hypothetical protein DUI87_19927 [Hirundo rustica rustica]